MIIKLMLTKPSSFAKQAEFILTEDLKVAGLTIPAGTKTDGATQPRWLLILGLVLLLSPNWLFWLGFLIVCTAYMVPPFGKYIVAAIVHDYLLDERKLTRHAADITMKRVNEGLGIKTVWAELMYRLVRINSKLFTWDMG